jgi:hypothetical protein
VARGVIKAIPMRGAVVRPLDIIYARAGASRDEEIIATSRRESFEGPVPRRDAREEDKGDESATIPAHELRMKKPSPA